MTNDNTNLQDKFKELYEDFKTTGDVKFALRLVRLACKNLQEWNKFYFCYIEPQIRNILKQLLENQKGEAK